MVIRDQAGNIQVTQKQVAELVALKQELHAAIRQQQSNAALIAQR
jgi:hypothetical protein